MFKSYDIYIKTIEMETGTVFVSEYRFHPVRKWRFDYACPELKLAIEFDGGNYIQGRHNRPRGRKNDIEKFNTAQDLGWKVYNVLPQEVDIDKIVKSIKIREEEMKKCGIHLEK